MTGAELLNRPVTGPDGMEPWVLAGQELGSRLILGTGGVPSLDVLRQVNGNRMAAAKMLGISRRALYRRLERHGITDEASGRTAGRRL